MIVKTRYIEVVKHVQQQVTNRDHVVFSWSMFELHLVDWTEQYIALETIFQI
jgi:hypothetical protein